ncbi:uncharacterized protein TOT_020000167 [Theileria orientalis strain Shintoku]|uniref:Uncharacterized protein n=1 Tax=Theileria orientalis strain Shintoku TaxID=869250 RepID=J4D714_THEOR|nr:uncharacterized protein TOT_020000167 [Theileria orientalis strain Shintoku]BAM39895.1 uncharacterized protein TOT_020000167 [Theileria orientalis strain Shintoku]|eukprot:XP_009690196.1 uncharacterized protein TOT_020000167 [Theileria orientalis strain Shintoku]
MKFGSKLESFLIKQWADKYIRYKYLNRLLKGAYHFKHLANADVNDEDLKLQAELFSLDQDTQNETESELSLQQRDEGTFPEEAPSEAKISEASLVPGLVSIPIPEEKEMEFESPSEALRPNREESFKSQIPSIDTDDAPDVIKLVVDVYEEKGHLDFEEIPQLKKSPTALSKSNSSLDMKMRESLRKLESFVEDSEYSYEEQRESINGEVSDAGDPRDSEQSLVPLESIEKTNTSVSLFQLANVRARKKKDAARKAFFKNMSIFKDFTPLKSELEVSTSAKRPFKTKSEVTADSLALFDMALREDIRTVVLHYASEMEYISVLINFLRKDIVNRGGHLEEPYKRLAQKAITALWDSCDKLKSYLNTNILAVYKLLKKKDKLLETRDLEDLYPKYKEIFLSVDTFKETNASILSLYNLVSEPKQVDFDKIKKDVESSLDSKFIPAYYLSYIMGLCTVLFVVDLLLCWAHFRANSKYPTVLSQLPIFRVFFVFGIIWYGIGWCQGYLEQHGVNYQFLFKLSNNYNVSSRDFYFFGALQTFICLFMFFLFLLDCKIGLFGTHNLYFIYPIVLIVLSFGVVLLPKKNFKLKLRRKMVYAIFRSLMSPICIGPPVSLEDSILGDVYTSLTKPFVDLLYVVSYLTYGAWKKCTHMHPALKTWAVPVVLILPFFLRFSQCLRRYIKEHLWLHMGNMIKYVSAMICVIISSIKWSSLTQVQSSALIVTCYLVATLYNFLWDYFIDWGLSLPPNIFKRRNNRKMYGKKSYYLACLVNLLCRFTWALTVTPFTLMEDRDISVNILILIISIIEIFRRIVWVTFRMETEHLLNSYKYRTALWVPKLYKCKSVIVNELSILNKRSLNGNM